MSPTTTTQHSQLASFVLLLNSLSSIQSSQATSLVVWNLEIPTKRFQICLKISHCLFDPLKSTSMAAFATASLSNVMQSRTRPTPSNFIESSCTRLQWRRRSSTIVAARRDQGSSTRYVVEDVSPPPQNLGLHDLPPNTHNGDTITIEVEAEAEDYIVQRTVLRYKLERGKYRPKEKRLEVRKTGRFLYNK